MEPASHSHLQVEVTLAAGPLRVGVQRVFGEEIALLAGLAEDGRDHGAQLGGVSAALAVAVKVPLGPQSPPPLVGAEVGGVVLHGDLLPGLQAPPGLHPDLTVGLHPEHGVADTAVVQQRERGEDGSPADSWENRVLFHFSFIRMYCIHIHVYTTRVVKAAKSILYVIANKREIKVSSIAVKIFFSCLLNIPGAVTSSITVN